MTSQVVHSLGFDSAVFLLFEDVGLIIQKREIRE